MVLKVLAFCFFGSKLDATTANPTITPRWTVRDTRSGVFVNTPVAYDAADAGRRTEEAVCHEAYIKQGNREPGKP